MLRTGLGLALAAGGLALVGWSSGDGPAPSAPSPTPLTGEAIYLKAVHAMRGLHSPPYVVFKEDVAVRNMSMTCSKDGLDFNLHHGDQQRTFAVSYRSSDGVSVGSELPSGKACGDVDVLDPVGSGDGSMDIFGSKPSPSPTPEGDMSITSGGPPIIAAVRSESAHNYRITLVGEETFEGHRVYRLALSPYRRAPEYPLTGMLVDAETWLVRQASGEVSGHFVLASGWVGGTVTFSEAGPWWVVRDEHFDMAGNALVMHARASIDAHGSGYAFPSALPDVPFPTPRPKQTPR